MRFYGKLCKGEFSIRMRLQKSIIAKIWRSKGKFTGDRNTLFYNEKVILL